MYSTQNWTTFWFSAYIEKWRNNCSATKWQLDYHFSCDIPKLNNFCERRIFYLMLSYQSVMAVLWANECLTFTFYETFSNSIPNCTTFVKEVFDLMFSLESDEMTALWPNDIITSTFYVTFSNSTTSWTTFVKYFFGFDAWFIKWRNDCFARQAGAELCQAQQSLS